MTALDLQAELERWINYNAKASEPIDFFNVLEELLEQGVQGIEVRKKLKEMGFIIDDYGVLKKRCKSV